MHKLIWFLILIPPFVAYCLWQGLASETRNPRTGSESGFGMTGQRVRFGSHGYWILLAICYAACFGVALAMHKI
jgi:hypothetical protein